eukprot:scaffold8374_cov175-Amphora_coffeaeformis.AAC.123
MDMKNHCPLFTKAVAAGRWLQQAPLKCDRVLHIYENIACEEDIVSNSRTCDPETCKASRKCQFLDSGSDCHSKTNGKFGFGSN